MAAILENGRHFGFSCDNRYFMKYQPESNLHANFGACMTTGTNHTGTDIYIPKSPRTAAILENGRHFGFSCGKRSFMK